MFWMEVIMVSVKIFYYAKFYILLMIILTSFVGCGKKESGISKVLAFTTPLGCMVGSAVGKKLAGKKNKNDGAVAGAIIGGTTATAVSIATGGVLYAAASAAFSAITTSLFKHKKKDKNTTQNKKITV